MKTILAYNLFLFTLSLTLELDNKCMIYSNT